MERPDPSKFNITYEDIIKAGKEKQSPRKSLFYLRLKGYPMEYVESLLMKIKRTRDDKNEYYRASSKVIADIVYGYDHPALKKNPNGVYQGMPKIKEQPKIKRTPLRKGTEWLNLRKEIEREFKFRFKPENYDHRYKSLDEFVSFATEEEINEYRSN